MIIKRGKAFIGGRFVERDVFIQGGRFAEAADGETLDASGCYVLPGLVDIHTHGACGYDFCSDNPEHFKAITHYYLRNGVTSVLATSMTMAADGIFNVFSRLASFENPSGARIAGINMEGPFFSVKKRGAQPLEHLKAPDSELLSRLNEASGNKIKLVCVAPELPGAEEFIKEAGASFAVSLAHTEANYDDAAKGFKAGANHVTHLFNGMNPFLHRDPGVVGAAMDFGAYVEVISDGVHLHPAVVRFAFKVFGAQRVCLISDSLACAGLSDGDYDLAGQHVTVRGGCATLDDGTIAGSSISLMDALRRAVSFGVALEDATLACTKTPAESAGLADIGAIEPGYWGDCVLLDEKLELKAVIKGGERAAVRSHI